MTGKHKPPQKVEITSLVATLSIDEVTTIIKNRLDKGRGPEAAEIFNMLSDGEPLRYVGDSLFKLSPITEETPELKGFTVIKMEVYEQYVQIQAVNGDDAICRVEQGDGDYGTSEFHSCLDLSKWKVEEGGDHLPSTSMYYYRVAFSYDDTGIIQIYVEVPVSDSWSADDIVAHVVDRGLITDQEVTKATGRSVIVISEDAFRRCTDRC